MMMNVNKMTTVELLMEKCYMEQLGYPGEVQLLEINEEIAARKEQKEAMAPITTKVNRDVRVSEVSKHLKHKRTTSVYGHYQYTPYETDLNEVTFEFRTSYPGSYARVVYDSQNTLQKVIVEGHGRNTFNKAIKSLATSYFHNAYLNQ